MTKVSYWSAQLNALKVKALIGDMAQALTRNLQNHSNKKTTYGSCSVVTGSGSGIGRAFALELASRGGQVLCSDINFSNAKETAEMIHLKGGDAFPVACDVTVLEQVEALAVRAEEIFGRPADLIINNAGVGIGGQQIGDVIIKDWEWVVGVNMWGAVNGCHVFAPKLRQLGRGGIINVCSTASFSAAPLMGPYNVTKAAVFALSETLAAEMTGTGIKVTALCPAFVKTNIFSTGRITGPSSALALKLMDWTGISPESLVNTTLNAFDRGELYVLPQLSTRVIWRLKRLMPRTYTRGTGLVQILASLTLD